MDRIIEYYFNNKLYQKCSYNEWDYSIGTIRGDVDGERIYRCICQFEEG